MPQPIDSTPRLTQGLLLGVRGIFLLGLLVATTSCGLLPRSQAEAQTQSGRPEGRGGPPAVDVAIARTGTLQEALEYTGTTAPIREVSLRSQVEGRLLDLRADAGDPVSQNQPVAELDDALLESALIQAEAELAARESEVARAQTQVSSANTRIEQARLELQQARADSTRLQTLWREGAISEQEAELARTSAQTAEQLLRSAQAQLRNEQQAVAAAQRRVVAQRAAVTAAQERQSYTLITSPISGLVLERLTEPGNLVQPGSEILRLGDFSRVKVTTQVSDLALATVEVGQSVQVRLDAFPNQTIQGTVTRIAPAADPTARLIPVEITIPNDSGRIGSGLLARVSFAPVNAQRVVVPQTALQSEGGRPGASSGQGAPSGQPANRSSTVFVVTGDEEQPTVAARSVTVGEQADGKVEILTGLKPGERFVARSGGPLKDGATVRLSALSETNQPQR